MPSGCLMLRLYSLMCITFDFIAMALENLHFDCFFLAPSDPTVFSLFSLQNCFQHENSSPENVAIDKPSPSLLQFMNKHYGLNEPLWQSTNYVVYPPFFNSIKPCDSLDSTNRPHKPSTKTEALNDDQVFFFCSSRNQNGI